MIEKAFDPHQRRDSHGRWVGHGGSVPSVPSTPRLPAPRPAQPDAVQANELHARWASLDRALLPYAGNPRADAAQMIIGEQKNLTTELHHLDLDRGGPSGVGKPGGPRDVVVIGAGPAGMSAAVYGGSEGLDTLMIDANNDPGGQARLSSRIENVLGFPAGVVGDQFAHNSLDQAQRLGAETRFGVRVTKLKHDPKTGLKHLTLSDGSTVDTRAVVLAGGVEFHHVDIPGANTDGVVYGDSKDLRRVAGDQPVVIVGGANSAGQAAVDVAAHQHVTIVVRSNIDKNMSAYLIQQLRSDPNVTILENSEVASINNPPNVNHVSSVTLKDGSTINVGGVGFFIGSAPQTDWTGVERDQRGYIKVGGSGRGNLETSLPGVYAVGDNRAGSVHRVATAAGDGAAAVSQLFEFLPTVGAAKAASDRRPFVPDDADKWLDQMYELDTYEPFTGFDSHDVTAPTAEVKADDVSPMLGHDVDLVSKAIGAIHRMPEATQTTLVLEVGMMPGIQRDYDPSNEQVGLATGALPADIAHSMGHKLDKAYGERFGGYLSDVAARPGAQDSRDPAVRAMHDVIAAIKASRAYARLSSSPLAASRVGDYWTSAHELFARAYERYIGGKSDPGAIEYGTGWTSDDFAEIAAALDSLLADTGLKVTT